MFERFTGEARATVVRAEAEAAGLGQPFIGTEHLLLALFDPGSGAAAGVLADTGLTGERVRGDIRRLVAGGGRVLDEADAEALRSLGIDLGAVRAAIEESFGPGVLDDVLATRGRCRRSWLAARRSSGARRPFSPRAKKAMALSLREAVALRHNYIDSCHLLLGLLREGDGLAARILSDAGVDLHALRQRTIASMRQAA